jgi:hypothetical protein
MMQNFRKFTFAWKFPEISGNVKISFMYDFRKLYKFPEISGNFLQNVSGNYRLYTSLRPDGWAPDIFPYPDTCGVDVCSSGHAPVRSLLAWDILIREKDFVQEKVPLNATTTRDYNIGVDGLVGCIGALQSIPLIYLLPVHSEAKFPEIYFCLEISGNFRKL